MKRPTRRCKLDQMDRSELHSPGVDTDDRLAFGREALPAGPGEFDLRMLRAARQGMRDVVAERMRQFDTAGHAGDHEPIPLPEMAPRYADEHPTRNEVEQQR
jgi:hypothetical protein